MTEKSPRFQGAYGEAKEGKGTMGRNAKALSGVGGGFLGKPGASGSAAAPRTPHTNLCCCIMIGRINTAPGQQLCLEG